MNAISASQSVATIRPVLIPQNFDQLVTFSEMAAATDMVPKDYRGKPGNIMLAVQMGSELGLSPMQSINSIAVINGRPGVWGDGLIGLCRASPLCEDIVETIEGEGDERTARCVAKRRGSAATSGAFSVADAKRAGLWQTEERVRRKDRQGNWFDTTNDSPWFRYPDRMLQNRARGFALRDAFPDILRGLKTVEELRDTPPDDFRGTTLDARPVPPDRRPTDQPPTDAPTTGEPTTAKRTYRQIIDDTAGMLTACDSLDAVVAIGELPAVRYVLEHGNATVRHEMNVMLSDAFSRWRTDPDPSTAGDVADESESAEDTPAAAADTGALADFPGDRP